MSQKQIESGVFLTNLPGEKFNRCKFTVHMIVPGLRKTATSLSVLPNILSRSCADIPDPVQLSRYFFKLYGADLSSESYQVGANRVVSFSVSGIKNSFALNGEDLEGKYIDILCKLIFAPKLENNAFSLSDVEIEKNKQKDLLKSEMNNKRSYVLRQARRKLFGDSAHGLESAGYLSDIEGLTPQNLYYSYIQLLENAVFEIFVSGTSAEKAEAVVLPYIGKIDRKPQEILKADAIEKVKAVQYFSENIDTSQGKLCILLASGMLVSPKQASALRLGVAVLGMLPTSRLFTNVREKQGLCYYCAASFSAFSGTLCIDSGIEHENAKKAAAAIMHELEIMQKEPISQEELDNALLALKNSFTAAADSLDALESWVFNERLRETNMTLQQAEELMFKITKEDIRAQLAEFAPSIEYVIIKGEGK